MPSASDTAATTAPPAKTTGAAATAAVAAAEMTAAAATVAATPPPTHYHRTGGRLAHLLLVRDYLPECDAAALCRRIQQNFPRRKSVAKKKSSAPGAHTTYMTLEQYMRPGFRLLAR